MKNEIIERPIRLVSKGVIDSSALPRVKANLLQRIKDLKLDTIEATEDNKKVLKELRATLNNELKQLEAERIALEKEYNKPVEAFKLEYKDIPTNYKNATDAIKVKLDFIDEGLMKAKNELIKKEFELNLNLFNNQVQELGFNNIVIKFEDLNLNYTLSTKNNDIFKEINTKFDDYTADFKLIAGDVNRDKLLKYYLKHKNYRDAMAEVQEDIRLESKVKEIVLKPTEAVIDIPPVAVDHNPPSLASDVKYYAVPEKLLLQLIASDNELICLHEEGVDNWEYYGEGFEDYNRVNFDVETYDFEQTAKIELKSKIKNNIIKELK